MDGLDNSVPSPLSSSAAPPPPPSQAGVRMFEVEQAAHALRQRLAIATAQSNTPLTSFIDTFKDLCRASSRSSVLSDQASRSVTHTPDVPSDNKAAQDMCGLGISTYVASDRQQEQAPPSLNDLLFRPMLQSTSKGNAAAQAKRKAEMDESNAKVNVWQRRSPHVRQGSSAFLEQIAVFSPKFASNCEGFDVSHLSGTPKLVSNPRHARNRSDALSSPHLTSFTSPSRRFSHEFEGHVANGTPHRSYDYRRRKSSHLGVARRRERSLAAAAADSRLPNGHPASSLAQDLGLADGGQHRPARSRHASSHDASRPSAGDQSSANAIVAQDPELLASMMLAGLASGDAHGQLTPSPRGTPFATPLLPTRRHSTFVDPNSATTPRKRQKSAQATMMTPMSAASESVGNDMDLDFDNGEGGANGNEAAAHSLLDLAASPSPLRDRSTARFAGYTPSLRFDDDTTSAGNAIAARRSHAIGNAAPQTIKYRLMDDIDRHEATRNAQQHSQPTIVKSPPPSLRAALQAVGGHRAATGRGHARTGSLGSHGVTDAGSPFRVPAHRTPESARLSSSLHPATPPSSIEARSPPVHAARSVRVMSPPMTPPRSEEARARSKTEQGDRRGALRFNSPETPSRRRGSLKLVSEVDDEQEEDDRKVDERDADVEEDRFEKKIDEISRDSSMDDTSAPSTPPPPSSSSHAKGQDAALIAAAVTETPRTPPHVLSTPKTPKAPGSNFSYGDFLHVSPSPKPRMRTSSHHDGSLTGTAVPFGVTETPTRGTRSRARFLAFDDGGDDDDDDEMTTFTVGPLSNGIAGKGVGGLNRSRSALGGAFEHVPNRTIHNDHDGDHDNSSAMIKSAKRSATVLQPSPTVIGPKRRRSTATLHG